MNDETADLLVIVTREALEGVASPPDASEERLMEYADIFGKVATYKLEHGRAGGEVLSGCKWKTSSSGEARTT
ncbi:hypothetical protein [Rhizobium mongolense]